MQVLWHVINTGPIHNFLVVRSVENSSKYIHLKERRDRLKNAESTSLHTVYIHKHNFPIHYSLPFIGINFYKSHYFITLKFWALIEWLWT
jgi:hypothetical protein